MTKDGNIFIPQFLCIVLSVVKVGLGGLGVTWSPRDPRFADSNPAEVDGFFQDVKIQAGGPESEISGSLKNLKPEKNRLLSKI